MTIRKRNDDKGYERGSMGIDEKGGMDYTDRFNVPDQQDAYPGNREVDSTDDIKGKKVRNNPGHAAYTSDGDAGLVRRQDFEHSAGSRQIWRDVEENQRPDGEYDVTGALRSGVSRSQS